MENSRVGLSQWLRVLPEKLGVWFVSLQPNQRSYFSAVALGLLFLLIKPFSAELAKSILSLAFLFWIMAMLADLQAAYRRVAEMLPVKVALVVAFALGSNFGIAHAAQIVNQLVGIDPSRFLHTIGFVSLLLVPPLIAVALNIALFFGLALGFFIFMFHLMPDDKSKFLLFPWHKPRSQERYRPATVFVQLLSFITVCSLAYQWNQTDTAYDKFVRESAEWFLYSLEMHERAPCPLEAGQRVAFLDGDHVLIATKVADQISFKVGECRAL